VENSNPYVNSKYFASFNSSNCWFSLWLQQKSDWILLLMKLKSIIIQQIITSLKVYDYLVTVDVKLNSGFRIISQYQADDAQYSRIIAGYRLRILKI
jgi:hypothetical protein